MGHEKSFDEILKQKMAKNFTPKKFSEFADPVFSTTIWASTPTYKSPQPRGRVRLYHVWKKSHTVEAPSPDPPPEEPAFQISSLSLTAQEALQEMIQSFGAQELNQSKLKLSELKKCFRRLAKKLHPDLAPHVDPMAFPRMRQLHLQVKSEAQSLVTESVDT